MATTVTMPQLGESVVEGTVGKWLVQEGDQVESGQPVVEILTDKADSEVPATASGVVTKLHAEEGAVIGVGAPLLDIDAAAKGAGAKKAATKTATQASPPSPSAEPTAAPTAGAVSAPVSSAHVIGTPVIGTPAARKYAREHGVDLQNGSLGGRVTKDDLLRAGSASAAQASAAPARPRSAFQVPPYVAKPGDEVVPFSRRRKIIADHMVYSKLTSPHVMTVAECDMYKASTLRDQHKNQLKKEGINLTFLAFIASAVTRALRDTRELNARVLDDSYVLLKEINLGIAVDTPEGLVVPVLKHADQLTVRGLARAIDELALKARENKLTPDDLAGKTFTISNPGKKGNLFGAAIISQPNVGILRIGEMQKRVVVVEHEGQDVMAIHPVMHMALSYDHRIVDGVAANSFLYQVVEILEAGDFNV
jgi:2-oxoglutarate dehydrogenase E2 component (dihydrolipoamide succinyltransferase)